MESNKKTLTLIKGSSSSFKLIIPANVEAKIRHMCSVIHDVEWSGILFYTHEGNFEDDNFVATCKDIFIMDVGNSTYTEFKDSCDVINYRALNDLLDENIHEGLIHSHNNMSTFFSGTDDATLVEEGTNCNHFLSLIVNNAGKYTARITRKLLYKAKEHHIIEAVVSSSYNSYNNKEVIIEEEKDHSEDFTNDVEEKYIQYFDLEIDKENPELDYSELDERIKAIKESKTKPKTVSYNYGGYSGYNGYYNYYDKDYKSDSYKTVETPKSTFNVNKQYSLFNDDSTYDPYDKDPSLYLYEKFDPELTKKLGNQLLLGSILADAKKIDIDKWVKKMDDVYIKRFGNLKDKNNFNAFENWVDSMLDVILYTKDNALLKRLNAELSKDDTKFNASDTVEICAYSIIEYFKKLPESFVKNKMIEILNTYL